jgi:hypothetical protein
MVEHTFWKEHQNVAFFFFHQMFKNCQDFADFKKKIIPYCRQHVKTFLVYVT